MFDAAHLIYAAITGEKRRPEEKLGRYAALAPDVDGYRVVSGAEDKFRGAIVTATDIGNVRLPSYQYFCGTKVAELHHV